MGARLRVFLTRARKIEPCSTSQQQMYPPQKVKDARRNHSVKRTGLVRRKNSG